MVSPEFSSAPHNGIRALGESERSGEFKAGREAFVTGVNDWLKEMRALQASGKPLRDGTIVGTSPVVVTTVMGDISSGRTQLNAIDYTPGASLTGDGVTTPLVFQSVRHRSDGSAMDVLIVTGSDPVARAVSPDYGGPGRQTETVAEVFVSSSPADGSMGHESELRVTGNGTVWSRHIDSSTVRADGVAWNVGDQLVRSDDVDFLGQAALGEIYDIAPLGQPQ